MAPTESPTSTSASPVVSPHDRIYRNKHQQFRPKDLLVIQHSDSDSASTASEGADDQASISDSQISSAFTRLWTAYRSLERHEAFTSGANAVLQVAGNISESVFVYPLLESAAAAVGSDNYRARVTKLEIRQGAADAVRGALAVGATAAALVPSQTLPLFLPNLFAIAQSQQAAVFHVSCEAIRQDLAVGSSYEFVYALQHSGALLLNSSNPQELHDLAVVAHVSALRLKKLLVHFYDGARVAKELTKLQLLAPSALKTLADIELASPYVALNDSRQQSDVAEHVQLVMDDLFQVLQKQYKVYEYYGAPDATHVVVVMGEATAAIQEAVAYEQMLGNKVGVVQVRLLLPWSHALFAEAMPSTVQRVAVLENISTGAFAFQRGLLTQNVQVFFHSSFAGDQTPAVVTGIYGGVFRNFGFSLGMGRAVFAHLSSASPTRRSFVVAKSEALFESALETMASVFPQLDVVYGLQYELDGTHDAYSKQYLFWGFDEQDQRSEALDTSYAATLQLLNRNKSTQVSALLNHSAPSVQQQTRSVATLEVRVSLAGRVASGLQQGIEQADVSVVTRAALLKDFDVAANVKPNGTLLVHTNWKTIDDVDESPSFKAQLAAKNVTLVVVDLDELTRHVADDAIANVAPQVAFLKAAGLFDERVVFALLAAEFPQDKHTTLRSFVAAVWGDVVSIVYPLDEWNPRAYVDSENGAHESGENGDETKGLPSLSALEPSKISHSVVAQSSSLSGTGKRARHSISKDTQTAWKMVFADAFASRQSVRDHVTDIVKVTKWERLTPSDYSRNVFHVEMDITNTAIKYNIGEALAVFAHNNEKDVLTFLRTYNVDPEALVTLPVAHKAKKSSGAAGHEEPQEETLTYFQLFSQVLDIFGRPSKRFYQALADNATADKEKDTLTQLLEVEGKDEYKRRVDETLTFADLLEEFPSAKPTLAQLLTLVPRIKPRHYSIASSMKMNPTSVHLLIVVHDWTTPAGRYRIGQATDFLKDVKPGQQLSVSVCSSVMKLPVNPEDPIIMAGLGTGMAPFRAFIQERAFLKARGVKVGPVALYFGARSKAQEFLYGAELEQYEKEGLLTYLRCAFSRDQAHKIYIQDRIAEDKEILGDLLLNKNGHFYLCGPTWPVADVREALIGSIMSEGNMDRKQANAYIERMREQGRYVLEVY